MVFSSTVNFTGGSAVVIGGLTIRGALPAVLGLDRILVLETTFEQVGCDGLLFVGTAVLGAGNLEAPAVHGGVGVIHAVCPSVLRPLRTEVGHGSALPSG